MQGNQQRTDNVKVTGLKVLMGLALDENDEVVWAEGVRLVRGTPHAELHICHVVEDVDKAVASPSSGAPQSLLDTKQAAVMDFARTRLGVEPPGSWLRTEIHLGIGNASDELVQIATDIEADVIVVGAIGGGRMRDMIMGSTAATLFKASPCSVSLARPKEYEATEKSPSVEPPLAPGQGTMRSAHTYHYRRRLELRQENANVLGSPSGR